MEDGIYEVDGQRFKVEGGKTYKLAPAATPTTAGGVQPPPDDGMYELNGQRYKVEGGKTYQLGSGPGVFSDLVQTAIPTAVRSAVAVPTAIPSMADLAVRGAFWAQDKIFGQPSPEELKSRETLTSWLPSYGNVMKQVEKATGPLYEPKTAAGKILDIGGQTGAALATGNALQALRQGARVLPSLIQAAPKIAKTSAIGGAGTYVGGEIGEAGGKAIGGETGGQIGNIAGSLVGGPTAALVSPKVIPTVQNLMPYKKAHNISKEYREAAERLQAQMPGLKLTAGQITGDPAQLQREANAVSFRTAPQWAKDLPENQRQAVTQKAAESMGFGTDTAGKPVTRLGPLKMQEADQALKARELNAEKSHSWTFDPYDKNQVKITPNDPSIKSEFQKKLEQLKSDAERNLHKDEEANVFRRRYGEVLPSDTSSATLPAGATGGKYAQFRSELNTDINATKNEHLQGALRGLRDNIDAQMRESIVKKGGDPSVFDTIRKQIQNKKILAEPGVIDPQTGNVNTNAWSSGFTERTGPGRRVLDVPTQELVNDLNTVRPGTTYQPYKDPSGHLLGKAVAGATGIGLGSAISSYAPGLGPIVGFGGPAAGGYAGSALWGKLAPHLPLPTPVQAYKAMREFSPDVQARRLGKKLPVPELDTNNAIGVLFGSSLSQLPGR